MQYLKYSVIVICLWCVAARADTVLSRVVHTKYGKVQGTIRHHSRPTLPPIEVYLGVPYASPPTGEGRFTPTSSPLPWDHILKCDRLPPVCSQPLWNEGSFGTKGLVPEDVEAYYESVKPILRNQNEDCLYLNIYTPHDGGGKYAVIVYIHGESFSWGSGNLYDGGTLATYGQIVVITINYRLGPFGFLNTSPGGSRNGVVSNQGLMDQLAALSWVQENVAVFGGDPQKVTIAGHSTGAACVGYLLASPVLVPGLFKRAILMSGSMLSNWAEVPDALSVTVRLAKLLNCTVPLDLSRKHPETVSCLRNASTAQLINAMMPQYKFASVYGPSVDGVVVDKNFKQRLGRVLKDRTIDLLFGVTEGDGYSELTGIQTSRGLSIAERNRLFRTFVRNTYSHHLQEIYLSVAKEYTDWENPSQRPLQVRDWTIEAISDGSYLAPIIRFADIVSARSDAFMYVFSHRKQSRERIGSVFRSELPLLFGAPFQDSHFVGSLSLTNIASTANYTRADALVSEYLMRYWSNFAKSGHPDLPEESRPILSYHERSKHKNVSWEMYDQVFEKYLEINSRPRLRDHYRAHKVALWNWLLPELEDAGSKYPEAESEIWHTSQNGRYFIGPVRPLDPFRFLNSSRFAPTSGSTSINSPINEYLAPNVSAALGPSNREHNASKSTEIEKTGSLLDYTTALTLTVAIGLSLLVLNVILFAALLYKRERIIMVPKIKYDSVSAQPLCTVDSGLRCTPPVRGSITPPGKETQSSCSSSDQQCTELRGFPTPPDIGDRNTEVTFHSNSSMHSMISQPTSQFIPPPPLLETTPPTPPVGGLMTDSVNENVCSPSRCFTDGQSQFNSETSNQFPPTQGETTIRQNYIPEPTDIRYAERSYTQKCIEGSPCPVSSACSYPTNSCSAGQFCPPQYSDQYSTNSDAYSSSQNQFPESPCQYSASGDNGNIRFYNDEGSMASHIQGGRPIRSTTLTKQSSSGAQCHSKTHTSRSIVPSFATLPRQEHKETFGPASN